MISAFLKLVFSPISVQYSDQYSERKPTETIIKKVGVSGCPDECNALEKNQPGFYKERSRLLNLLGFLAEISEHVGTESSGYCLFDFPKVLNRFYHQSSFISSFHLLKQLIQ